MRQAEAMADFVTASLTPLSQNKRSSLPRRKIQASGASSNKGITGTRDLTAETKARPCI
jgi:hypothetical protein